MSDHHHTQTIPRGVLLGAAAMILFSVVLAVTARHARLTAPPVPTPPAIAVLDVRFEDRADGSIAMLDGATGRQVSLVPPRSNGFIRGVLRGMFRSRRLESLGHDGHFRLAREADGRLTLEDHETNRRIELDSFGPTNSAAFAQLLVDGQKVAR